LRILKGQHKRGWCVAYSPDGQTLVSGGWQDDVHVWDLAGHAPPRTVPTILPIVRQMRFLPGANTVVVCAGSNTLQFRKWPSWALRETIEPARESGHVLFSPSYHPGRSLVVGRFMAGDPETVVLAPVGAPLRELWTHGDMCRHIDFSPSGQRLASGGWDKRLIVGDTTTGEVLCDWETSRVNAVRFVDEDTLLAGVGFSVVLFDVVQHRPRWKLTAHRNLVVALDLSPDHRALVTASDDNTVAVWDLAARRLTVRFELPIWTDAHHCVAIAPDGQTAAVACRNGDVAIIDLD
jgi:WD40 repeat protein